jgi:molybdate transport system substrate-binding protein
MRLAMAVASLCVSFCISSCAPHQAASVAEVNVAAASNLTKVLREIAVAFEKQKQIKIVPSYGATAQLALQIDNGAPFDMLLAADTSHVDELIARGFALPGSRAVYARGQLVIWAPKRPDLRKIEELADPNVVGIVLAKPELAPYGEAAVESIRNMGLWDKLEKKIVYAPNIMAAKQFVDTSNGDAAFTALSLIIDQPGNYFFVDEKLHKPIDQALCIMKNAAHAEHARDFAKFLGSAEAREIFKRFGYGRP